MTDELFGEVMTMIENSYKSRMEPDFSFVQARYNAAPFERLVASLSEFFDLAEDTDLNEDVAAVYVLSRGEQNWSLQLSLTGPLAALFRIREDYSCEVLNPASVKASGSSPEARMVELVEEHGIALLDRGALSQVIEFNADGTGLVPTSLYRVAFSNTERAPWD